MKRIITLALLLLVVLSVYRFIGSHSKTEVKVTTTEINFDKLKEVEKKLLKEAPGFVKSQPKEIQDEIKKQISVNTLIVDTRDILRSENSLARGAAKSYKEVLVLEAEDENYFKIELSEALPNIGSVVLVSLDGPILIKRFAANESVEKSYKDGQEAMKGDWVKLDNIQNSLKTIEIETLSKINNRLRVYVQYFGENEGL